MSRRDLMVDIETLGTGVDATIFQISAAIFDITTGKVSASFNELADISKGDLNADGGTLQWWLSTDKELLNTLLNKGTLSPDELLKSFYEWIESMRLINHKDFYFWGNGILFDNAMIKHQFEKKGLNYPVYYRNDRDVRTIVELASQKLNISVNDLKKQFDDESLTKHNAMDDVTYQIKLVHFCYQALMN